LAIILGSVEWISSEYERMLYFIEVISVLIFSAEYLIRLWSCTSSSDFSNPIIGRIKFALTPMALIDLLAILPFYLPFFITLDLRIIRTLRLMRIFRLAKVGRYSSSLKLLKNVISERKEELIVTLSITLMLLVISSSLMYYAENEAQPDKFPDIPSTFWWGVSTLTTVGYGDVVPITAFGKIIGGIVSILGIGLFALPTGILGASFVEILRRNKSTTGLCSKCMSKLDFD
jgi:voltage-gated potassium channel